MSSLIFLGLGLVVLTCGADLLVRGASQLAARFGVSSLVIGLTIVAFGTSAPELSVSVFSTLNGQPDVAVGNAVGSNIFNVLFILGLSALIIPLVVDQKLVRKEVPVLILVSLLGWVVAADGILSRTEGIISCLLLVTYTVLLVRASRKENRQILEEYEESFGSKSSPTLMRTLLSTGMVVGGLALLVLGANWLVQSAVELARSLGVSELIVGLTIVAAGTSLPEVATSVVAAIKREQDIAVGNVIGSNFFNLLGVLGGAAVVAPEGLPVSAACLAFDLPVMIAVSIACLPVFVTGGRISRWEGFFFLGYYAAYLLYLILSTSHQELLTAYNWVMVGFVLPITLFALSVSIYQWARFRKARTI